MLGNSRLARSFAVALGVLAVFGCEGEVDDAPPTGTVIDIPITASASSVTADGVNAVKITVARTDGVAVTLTTTKGSFRSTGTAEASLPTGAGEVELVTCDSRFDALCTGNVRVTARSDDNGRGTVQVAFVAVPGSGGGCDAGGPENVCDDGVDNDCDGLVDCLDPDCRPDSPDAGLGLSCAAPGKVGNKCDFFGACVCPGGQNVEATCSDGIDNDCDGKPDCTDGDCAGKTCTANLSKCLLPDAGVPDAGQPSTCACPGGTVELACTDGDDNDCDGLRDCEDPDCLDAACDPQAPTYICMGTPGSCKDPSSNWSVTVTSEHVSIPADGVATSKIKVKVMEGSSPRSKQVTLALVGGGGAQLSSTNVTTNTSGEAEVTLTSGATGGDVRVNAAITNPSVTGFIILKQPVLGLIRFVQQDHDVMGVQSSGRREQNVIVFELVDTEGNPYPAGLNVSFEHDRLGGSTIGFTTPNCNSSNRCFDTHQTDAQGRARVQLNSGTAYGVVSVTAQATAGGVTRQLTHGNIAIVGAKASGKHISVDCTPKNVPAFHENNCLVSTVQANITCTAAFADRFNNVLGMPTTVQFFSEAGAAANTSSVTPEYNPSLPPSSQTGLGQTSSYVSVYQQALPVDVAPAVGEYSLTYDDGCGSRTHNPRDGLSTIIAITEGEEGFIDGSNGFPADGVYQVGEDFIDIGEPFIDANDNGVWDSGEFRMNTEVANSTPGYDGPNGVWDAKTTLWTQTRVLYSGPARALSTVNGSEVSRFYVGGSPPSPTTLNFPAFVVNSTSPGPATTDFLNLYIADRNFNQLVNSATFTVQTVLGDASSGFLFNPGAPGDNLGMSFSLQHCDTPAGNGSCSNTCQDAPCYTVAKVGNFGYGRQGVVRITGGATQNIPITIQASATSGIHTLHLQATGHQN